MGSRRHLFKDLYFLVDTLPRHALYSGQMVCGALRRTVLRLHQSLRRGGWVPGHVSTDLALDRAPHVAWRPGQGIGPIGSENKRKSMNETQTRVHHPKPPRLVQPLINSLVRTILRSPWHGMMSPRLLLLTFTGRKSGKAFTTPIRYVQEGETLRLRVLVEYPWWKNLVGEATVRVLLRGKMCTGVVEVLPEEGGVVVVKVHLKG